MRLGYTDAMLSTDRPPLVTPPPRIGTNLVPRYRILWVDPTRGSNPDNPYHSIEFEVDATAGQNGLSQAQGFSDAAACTGIVLTKFDGTAKGGVAIAIRKRFNLPVKFIGIGEQEADLEPFQVDDYVEALFDDAEATGKK